MFGNSVKIATLAGFDIKVSASWLLIAGLIVWSLSTGYFPMLFPEAELGLLLVLSVISMLGLFGSLILHELSHSLVARRYGVGITGITLFIFGGVAELESEPKSATSEFWIAVAGPAMSFALAFGFWVLAGFAAGMQLGDPLVAVLGYLATINLVLAVFNLLPAFPLDGGRVFRAMLWRRSGDMVEATRKAAAVSGVIAYMLIGFGLLVLFTANAASGLWPILIGFFILATSQAAYQQLATGAALGGRTVGALMSRDVHTADPGMTLSDLVEDVFLHHTVSFVPVVADGMVLGAIDTAALRSVPRAEWPVTRVGDVFVPLSDEMTVAEEMPAKALLDRIGRTGRRKYLVMEGRQLIGVVTLTDVAGHLNVVRETGG
ncbi:site-2 protease family protein [Aestuariibius sp. 2305UL40-4]|uniref:site-2 protease family protein n=1 Tax=Aestuariibius violaceus TaxID=3234132 RepID=UPI00345EDAD8